MLALKCMLFLTMVPTWPVYIESYKLTVRRGEEPEVKGDDSRQGCRIYGTC